VNVINNVEEVIIHFCYMKIWIAWYLVTQDSCPIGCAWIPTAPILKLIRRINQTAFDCLESVHCKYQRDNTQQQFKRSTEYLSRAEWKCIHISIGVNKNQSLVILPTSLLFLFFSFLFLRDTYCLLEHDMYYKEATFLIISVKCFYRPRVLLIAGSTIMVYNTIICTWWKWTVVSGQLTKRMRGKMGSSKLYVHSNYAIRNNDW